MKTSAVVSALAALAGLASAAPTPEAQPGPDQAKNLEERGTTINVKYPEGEVNGVSLLGIDSFRALPFAQPPVNNLRLRPPVRINGSVGTVDGSIIGPSCPQMYLSSGSGSALTQFVGDLTNIPLFQTVTNTQEDCLTVNVQRPTGTTADSKLPVLFWIYGGGFEFGTNVLYDGTILLNKGIENGQPFVFVAVNYRMTGFGFLGGKEILADGAANLGLLDQRMGLEWVADNIAAFGGDPDKVTIWGESAGAISVFDQMALYDGDITYNGSALFRGAIMNSGSMVPADAVDSPKAQAVYDQVVSGAGCASSNDTLACLRAVDYDTLLSAVNALPGIFSYNSVALAYLPRPDGTVLTDSPEVLMTSGKVAKVPFIIGDQEDEGTLFALFQTDLSTTAKQAAYLKQYFFSGATLAQTTALVSSYSSLITAGSPFRTSIFNELYPGFKRLAAIIGDMTFTLTRRAFLNLSQTHLGVPSWSYLSSYGYGTPILGTFHATDLLQVFYGTVSDYASNSIQTYYINFLYNLDPNEGTTGLMTWPEWSDGNNLMNFFSTSASLLADDFRSDSYDIIAANASIFRV